MAATDVVAKEADALENRLEHERNAIPISTHADVNGELVGSNQSPFPAALGHYDQRDSKLEALEWLGEKYGKDKKFQVTLPADVIKIIEDKKKLVEVAQFDKWVNDTFDLKDPTHVKMLKNMYPEFFTKRLEYIDAAGKRATEIEKIKLTGPQNVEELVTLYSVLNSEGPVPRLDLQVRESDSEMLGRGLFNPRRWFGMESPRGDGSIKVPGDERGQGLGQSKQWHSQHRKIGAIDVPGNTGQMFTAVTNAARVQNSPWPELLPGRPTRYNIR
jgi:hypothetical protein